MRNISNEDNQKLNYSVQQLKEMLGCKYITLIYSDDLTSGQIHVVNMNKIDYTIWMQAVVARMYMGDYQFKPMQEKQPPPNPYNSVAHARELTPPEIREARRLLGG